MTSVHRRRLLAAAAAGLFLPRVAGSQSLTPACGKPTASQTAGPFFKPRSPERINLRERGDAPLLVVTGVVISAQCRPVANALLDFWHADELGDYDNQGFRYRGHQFADAQGRFRLETILPAEYPGRTRHIRVNVQAPGRRILTTQLYFPSLSGNQRDGLYRPDLTLRMAKPGAGVFDFVVET